MTITAIDSLAAGAGRCGIAPASRPGLAVRRLRLTNFRSYPTLRLDLGPAPVVLTGPNGAGKTNLLEALSFLVPGRGLRRARLAEAQHQGCGDASPAPAGWGVAATVDTPGGSVELGTGLERAPLPDEGGPAASERRLVHVDGVAAGGQTALAVHVAAVWLTPAMDRLFVEGSGGRRRFLDRLVTTLDSDHTGRLAAYDNAQRQRARLLREHGLSADAGWLAALEDVMARHGVAVAAARLEAVRRLNASACDGVSGFPEPVLAVEGTVEAALRDTAALAVEDGYRDRLARARSRDAEAGTAEGPHRSDLAVHYRAKRRPAGSCSTGEQKALLIAIVLSAARLLAEDAGRTPLLLLDEVVAHLDADRRGRLFDSLLALGAQAWLTGTDRSLFAGIEGAAQFFAVHDSRLTAD
ncbi:MAG: DNA replication/repair protein RecF [Acetobacterales bacterium]